MYYRYKVCFFSLHLNDHPKAEISDNFYIKIWQIEKRIVLLTFPDSIDRFRNARKRLNLGIFMKKSPWDWNICYRISNMQDYSDFRLDMKEGQTGHWDLSNSTCTRRDILCRIRQGVGLQSVKDIENGQKGRKFHVG